MPGFINVDYSRSGSYDFFDLLFYKKRLGEIKLDLNSYDLKSIPKENGFFKKNIEADLKRFGNISTICNFILVCLIYFAKSLPNYLATGKISNISLLINLIILGDFEQLSKLAEKDVTVQKNIVDGIMEVLLLENFFQNEIDDFSTFMKNIIIDNIMLLPHEDGIHIIDIIKEIPMKINISKEIKDENKEIYEIDEDFYNKIKDVKLSDYYNSIISLYLALDEITFKIIIEKIFKEKTGGQLRAAKLMLFIAGVALGFLEILLLQL